MNETYDRELILVRLRLVDLIKSFFQSQPDAEKMSRWRGMFSALSKEQINPLFDTAVREFSALLKQKNLADLEKEYYDLFIDPFSECQVNTMASWYLDGRSFGQTLVALRGMLREAGLERMEGVVDSEDSLVMMLDIFASLIEEEKKTDSDASRQFQVRLLTEYLEPFSKMFSEAVEKNETAEFYITCCKLLRGYLDLEKGLVTVS